MCFFSNLICIDEQMYADTFGLFSIRAYIFLAMAV